MGFARVIGMDSLGVGVRGDADLAERIGTRTVSVPAKLIAPDSLGAMAARG